ncbi:MAG: SAM-dependent methyltransferase [Bacteroidota bacterium]|nr:SAM-dependent methyltransferase [Bacteroidota bacterium]
MASDYPKIILKKEKERSVLRYHPWIFSGAMQSFDPELKDGDIVEVLDNKGRYLCTGHFYHGSIAIKILSFTNEIIDQEFWNQKITKAFTWRKNVGLAGNKNTNCFRLIHAEGDNCPGLVIDVYDTTAVIQCHSIGMHRSIREIANAVKQLPFIDAIYDKSKENLPSEYGGASSNQFLYGSQKEIIVVENGNKFFIDVERGQKTGFFLDQRDNRNLLAHYCKDKTVLNTYSYSGGFSIYALNNGAKEVVSVDVSKTAMELTEKNIELNFHLSSNIHHSSLTQDVFEFFKTNENKFDIIILDPPAFAKSIGKRHNAVQAYKRLNMEGLKKVNQSGIIFTFSCSQVVDQQLFNATVMSAAIEAHRDVKILHYLSQPADHPINIFHPESAYLKGLVLYVN